jgi:UTRA domain
MYANGEPMQLATSYLPWSLAEGTPMAQRDTGPGGIYSRLADIGHSPVRFTEDVSTRMPTPEEAEFLRLTPPQPVFFLIRVAFDANDRRSRRASTSCPVIAGSSATHGRPIDADARKKFLYHFKAGPAGGRLRRPSSAGSTIATARRSCLRPSDVAILEPHACAHGWAMVDSSSVLL